MAAPEDPARDADPAAEAGRRAGSGDRARRVEGFARALRRPWRLNEATRLSLDAFAERYAAAHALRFAATGDTPSATWFLEEVVPAKSHGFVSGELGGGPEGRLFHAERPVALRRGQIMEGWTVALYRLPEARALAYGIACLWRPGVVWGGRVRVPVELPRDTTEISIGNAQFDGHYRIVVCSPGDAGGAERLFAPEFVRWFNGLPWEGTGRGVLRFELRNGSLCVHIREKRRTEEELDAFIARAAHVATRIVELSA